MSKAKKILGEMQNTTLHLFNIAANYFTLLLSFLQQQRFKQVLANILGL